MPLRIAYCINQYPKVTHSFIRREILALERRGIEVQRIALRGWKDVLKDEEDLRERPRTRYVLHGGAVGLLVAMVRAFASGPRRFFSALAATWRTGWRADRPLRYHLVYFAEACVVWQWLRESGASHVHAHFGTNAAEIVMLARLLGGPSYSFTVHGPEEFDKPQFMHLGEKIHHARFVVAISSFARSQIYRWIPHAEWPKVHVVHCGLEPAFHELARGLDRPPPERPRFVCVGRLSAEKGQWLLIEAAHRLAQKGVPFELVLGGDGEIRPELERLIESKGLGERVRITGWISGEQVREEILAARALVLPSFAEGLPVVIMEAMALRRPVLTTYVAGIPELVRPGRDGWLVASGDIEALVQAMEEALGRSVEELRAMGASAHDRVLERHDVDTEAAKLAELFRQTT